jgi:hypothetical protein
MRLIAAVISAVFATGQVWAHSDEFLATKVTPHGGQQKMSGAYHLELVVNESQITVYITDHGDVAQPTRGWSGSATLLSAGRKHKVALKPGAHNMLEGKAPSPPAPGAKLVISVTDAQKQREQARFELPSPKPAN